ncbi:MAG: hypothetical protein ABL974_18695, partial [Prosthecobacter sp.]
MPAPLTWDMPNQTYDSGASWDGVLASPRKAMNNTKAIIDFSGYSAAELSPISQAIHDLMTLNAATFTAPPVTMTALQTLVTTYDQKLVARASRASADVLAFNEARATLEESLGVLGNYSSYEGKDIRDVYPELRDCEARGEFPALTFICLP